MKINLGLGGCSNRLATLPESVFRPFLDENERNVVDVGRDCSHMVCDCRMAWTLDELKYSFRVKNLRCKAANGSSVPYRDFMASVNCPTTTGSSAAPSPKDSSTTESKDHHVETTTQ